MDVPASVKAGGSLLTKVSFTGVSEEKLCSAQWYQNGQPLEALSLIHISEPTRH